MKKIFEFILGMFGWRKRKPVVVEPIPPVPIPEPIPEPPPVPITEPEGYNSQTTKGTISKGSKVLVLEKQIFKVGDEIIIKTGGEPGQGERGTMGVGGAWPFTSYNTTEFETKESGHYAWDKQTGLVYRYDTNWIPFTRLGYYGEKAIPLALCAKITLIADNNCYLDKPASETTTTDIYYDHYETFKTWIQTNEHTKFIEGKFAVSRALIGARDITLSVTGSGVDKTTLFSPDGCESISINLVGLHNQGRRGLVSDMTLIGCNRDKGFAFSRYGNELGYKGYPINEYWENPFLTNIGVLIGHHYGVARNLKLIDCMGYACQLNGNGNLGENIDVELTQGEHLYSGWQLHLTGAYGENYELSKFKNCTFKSPKITHAWEGFRTTEPTFENCKSINGVAAFNGSTKARVINCDFEFTSDSKAAWMDRGVSPVWDVNSFLGAADDFVFQNVNIKQVGYNEQGHKMNGIYCRDGVKNVKIIGGSFTTPDMTDSNACTALFVPAEGALVDGFKVVGKMPQYYHENRNIYAASISVHGEGVGVVKNCQADLIRLGKGVIAENNTAITIDNG